MKTIKSITAIALLFATSVGFANTTTSANIVQNTGFIVTTDIDHKPFFRKAGGKLFINFFNEEMGDVHIRVIDSENRVLFNETLKDRLVVEKAFNFNTAEKDSYKVIVKEGNETYFEYYVVK